MFTTRNEHRATFKDKFPKLVEKMPYESEITDDDLVKWVKENDINISLEDLKVCIRELETRMGREYKKRLKRIRNHGYILLRPNEQMHDSVQVAQRKVHNNLKQASRRLRAVDHTLLNEVEQEQLRDRTMVVDAVKSIVSRSIAPKIGKKTVELLDHTSTHLKALSLFEKKEKRSYQ